MGRGGGELGGNIIGASVFCMVRVDSQFYICIQEHRDDSKDNVPRMEMTVSTCT